MTRGHGYITIVVDGNTGRLVWVPPGRDRRTLAKFLEALGETSCAAITHVSADAATWIARRSPTGARTRSVARIRFTLLSGPPRPWMRSAARRGTPRKEGLSAHARDLKHARYALWKNPEDLTDRQQKKLAWVSTVNRRLYRAYLLN